MFDLFDLIMKLLPIIAHISSHSSFPEKLSPSEEAECIEALLNGDESVYEKLIIHNLRLVAHVAKKYTRDQNVLDDLISIGQFGLIKGIRSFDIKKGTKLATYVSRCIENEIRMYLRSNKKQNMEVSLSDPIGVDKEGNEISLLEVFGTDGDLVPEQVNLQMNSRALYQCITSELTEREALVISLRYGLYNGKAFTQREVAAQLGISRSYVSRIESKAQKKIKAKLTNISL